MMACGRGWLPWLALLAGTPVACADGPAATVPRLEPPPAWIYPGDFIPRRPLFAGGFNEYAYRRPEIPPTACAFSPGVVYVLREETIEGVKLLTGKSVWQAPIPTSADPGGTAESRDVWSVLNVNRDVIQHWRLLVDPTTNSLSLAGTRLFSLQRSLPRSMFWRQADRRKNQLRAYDTRRSYGPDDLPVVLGGPLETRPGLRDIQWLAAPVLHVGRLYLPGEQDGWRHVFCLAADDLRILWKTRTSAVLARAGSGDWATLLDPEPGDGALVVASGERLYWTSHTGVVACLDAASGQLAWLARYWRQGDPVPTGRPGPWARATDPWHLSPPVLASGSLIAAPQDSQMLLCFDAATGAPRWRAPQQEARLLAGVHDGMVYTLGERLNAIELATGRTVRAMDVKALAGRLVGRPALAGGRLFVPTSTGIVVVDLARFTVIRRLSLAEIFGGRWSPEIHPPLGNLQVAGDVLLSAHPDGVVAFR